MKKVIQATLLSFMLCSGLWAIAQESPVDSATTEQTEEPTTTQKFMFYGLTGAGILLLILSYKQSKWGRKK